MIGSSRETVTRLLSDLKKKELIRLEGSTLVIRNKTALEAIYPSHKWQESRGCGRPSVSFGAPGGRALSKRRISHF